MRINVMQIIAGSNVYNGVSEFLLSYYSLFDRERIHFDFLFCKGNSMKSRMNEPFLKDSEFIELNIGLSGKINELITLTKRIKQELEKRDVNVVHVNTGSITITACSVIAARLAGVPFVIAHSHNADPHWNHSGLTLKKRIGKLFNTALRLIIRNNSDLLLACSSEAAEYLFGPGVLQLANYHQINNAINVDGFLFDADVRNSLRNEYAVDDQTIVVAGVGRLSHQKNPLFLVDVFFEFQKLYSNSVLWLVGDGELKNEVEKKVKNLNIEDSVCLFGQRHDVNQLMQAMDIFILPSIYEGLGIVAIEAQTAGLQVVLSDECSHESDISDLIHFIPLNYGPKKWASFIKAYWDSRKTRKNMYEEITDKGYNIIKESRLFEDMYYNLFNPDQEMDQ